MPIEVVFMAAVPAIALFLCWSAYLAFGLVVFLKTKDPQALQHVGTMARSFRAGSVLRQSQLSLQHPPPPSSPPNDSL